MMISCHWYGYSDDVDYNDTETNKTIMRENIESCLVAAAADDRKPQPCMMISKHGNTFNITGPMCGEATRYSPYSPYKGSVIWSLDAFYMLVRTCCWANNPDSVDVGAHNAHGTSL